MDFNICAETHVPDLVCKSNACQPFAGRPSMLMQSTRPRLFNTLCQSHLHRLLIEVVSQQQNASQSSADLASISRYASGDVCVHLVCGCLANDRYFATFRVRHSFLDIDTAVAPITSTRSVTVRNFIH